MMSVLPNGGLSKFSIAFPKSYAALDDVSATEWRIKRHPHLLRQTPAALDDVSATEWRLTIFTCGSTVSMAALDDVSATEWRLEYGEGMPGGARLHSMMSVLPNGGTATARTTE